MKLTWELNTLARCMSLALLCLGAAQAHASLESLTLDNGTKTTLDTATGLTWRSFDATTAGEAQGFRMATVTEFDALLRSQGYSSLAVLPAGMGSTYTPSTTATAYKAVVTLTNLDGSPIDSASLPKAYWDARAQLDAQYASVLSLPPATDGATDPLKRYKSAVYLLGQTYDLDSTVNVINETITVPGSPVSLELTSGGVNASLYGSGRDAAFSIEGMHEYDNSYQWAVEQHFTYMGQVSSDKGLWVGALTSNYVPHQCQPGDAGYNAYSNNVQYCGGRSSSSAYLGPEQNSGFTPAAFNNTDHLFGKKPMGYFMVQSVPEPSTMALMGLGLLGMAGLARRRQSAPAH